ncbi:HisA/HisF-related TIM barrel protein, partial [Klebsiella pneumoniae]|uniref:HisA/HisF-related TIM barrel protein n=1 Tax=Klebsiella pneumoniae TaxID=573 RepID=UPI002109DF6B
TPIWTPRLSTSNGYDLQQLAKVRAVCHVPLIASGGAGTMEHFLEAFRDADVDGALAASVFHKLGSLCRAYAGSHVLAGRLS